MIVQADAVVDWTDLRYRLQDAPHWQVSVFLVTCFVAWAIVVGSALRPAWHQRAISFLIRQPISNWRMACFLVPTLWIMFLPIAGVWWLAPRHVPAPAHYLCYVGLVWTISIGASYRRLIAAKWIAIGTASAGALVLAYGYYPWTAVLALIASVYLLPASISDLDKEVAYSDSQSDRVFFLSGEATFAVFWRDLFCLWRLERNCLIRICVIASISAMVLIAFRLNGGLVGRDMFSFTCGLFSASIVPVYDALQRLKFRLGSELIRLRWPISLWQRGVALLSVAAAISFPALAMLGAIGANMGAANLALFLVYSAVSILLSAALFCRTLVSPTVSIGWSAGLHTLHFALAQTLQPTLYLFVALSSIVVGRSIIVNGLRNFTAASTLGRSE